ncbi:MAG: glycoside hydrolase family 44 protein, partial [Ilumatobacteraceae bacterium]
MQTSGSSTSVQAGADERADVRIGVDVSQPGEEISPLILGVSGGVEVPEMVAAGVTLDSWGGNPSTRYNYQVGHLWNAASDWEFRNTDYGGDGDIFRKYAALDRDAGIVMRMSVPTLGWVAKDNTSCSFPDDEGGCLGGTEADCANPGPIADPRTTSVESTPELVAGWVAELVAEGLAPRFIAMDNEPELWGHTHYDVHPECPTYEELLDKYLQYATAIRAVAPDAELTGPAMCCWYDYWRIAPGPADGSGEDFLTWFLARVREHDEARGTRSIDVVDVHFYP